MNAAQEMKTDGFVSQITRRISDIEEFVRKHQAELASTGSNTGDVTLAVVGATPNTSGASLSGQVLSLQPADGTRPGVVTELAQSFGGAKTFVANPIIANTAPSLSFTDTTAAANSLIIAIDANLAQFREAAGASGSGLVIDMANSRLGYGTAAPQGRVHISLSVNAVVTSILDNPSTGNAAYTELNLTEGGTDKLRIRGVGSGFSGASGGANAVQILGIQNAPMLFGTNSAFVMWLTATGNLRIGSAAAPASRLDIGTGALTLSEMTAPAAPAANGVVVYAVDNGAGKTQLMALFATGAAQQLAIQP